MGGRGQVSPWLVCLSTQVGSNEGSLRPVQEAPRFSWAAERVGRGMCPSSLLIILQPFPSSAPLPKSLSKSVSQAISGVMKPSIRACLLSIVFPLLLVSCGRQEGYEIRGDKVIWNSWRGDGLFGKWSEAELTEAQGFEILQPQGYAKNATHVFHGGGRIEDADAATFQMLGKRTDLAKDARRVYLEGRVIEGADAATFASTDMFDLGKDTKDYYLRHEPLHVRDFASFKVLDANAWRKDHHIWARDKLDYYVGTKATTISDSASFEVVQAWYAKDAKQVYFGSAVLAGADAVTFQGCGGESGEFAKDAKQVYWQGQVVEGCDAANFRVLKYRYAKDSKRAYFCYAGGIPPLVLPGSDAKTFEVIGPSSQGFGYAKDAKQVFQGANTIPGADPATFVVDSNDTDNASDKNRRYRHGEPLP